MNNNYKPQIKEVESPLLGARCFKMGSCQIILARESYKMNGELGWHLSISHPKRYPSWDEIAFARYALIPNELTMAQILPPKDEYVNIHPNCFHLWEVDEIRQ